MFRSTKRYACVIAIARLCVWLRQHELIIMQFDYGLNCFTETSCVFFIIYIRFNMGLHAYGDFLENLHAGMPEFFELALYLHDQAARHDV